MSPEQLRGEAADVRSDIFSFGVVIYEMLSGRPAFQRTTDAETIGAILHEQPLELSSIDPNLPEALAEVVRKCLSKDVEQRYQTVEQVADDLNVARNGNLADVGNRDNSLLSTESSALSTAHRKAISAKVAKPRVTSSIEYLVNEVKGHRQSVILATGVVIILAAVLGYYYYSARRGEAIDSLAVLPFVNVNNDSNAEYLSDGLSDSVINSLSQLPNLKKVISLNSVLPYKGKQIDPHAVGRELDVGERVDRPRRRVVDVPADVAGVRVLALDPDARAWQRGIRAAPVDRVRVERERVRGGRVEPGQREGAGGVDSLSARRGRKQEHHDSDHHGCDPCAHTNAVPSR